MDTYLAVASKRDWRSYADRTIPAEVVTRILDAGRLAGSGSNKQPWTFVVVEDAERKERWPSRSTRPATFATLPS